MRMTVDEMLFVLSLDDPTWREFAKTCPTYDEFVAEIEQRIREKEKEENADG